MPLTAGLSPLALRSLLKTGVTRCCRRSVHVSSRHNAHPDDFKRVPQSPRQFPNFSLPPSKPVTAPKPIHVYHVVSEGKTHSKTEDIAGYTTKTGEPSLPVYEGARMAASVVTQALAQGEAETLTEIATPEAVAQLSNLWSMDGVDRNSDLISMPQEDILTSWIDSISQNDRGEHTALLVTYSFPGYGRMVQGLKDNKAREVEFESALRDKMQQTNTKDREQVKSVGEEISKSVLDFKKSQYDPYPFYRNNPVVLSNFHFVKRNDEWLIDGVSMTDAKQVINPFSHFRWRGRIATSFRLGTFMSALRLDWATDVVIIVGILILILPPYSNPFA